MSKPHKQCGPAKRCVACEGLNEDEISPFGCESLRKETLDFIESQSRFGQVRLLRISSNTASAARRSLKAAGRTRNTYFLTHITKGEGALIQGTRETRLRSGDFILSENSFPFALELQPKSAALIVACSSIALKAHLPTPGIATGVRLAGSEGVFAVLSTMLEGLCEEPPPSFSGDVSNRVGECLLNLLATGCLQSFGAALTSCSLANARRTEIRSFIEDNLHDFDLSVQMVAKRFRISRRYIHMLFSDENETISEYIRRRRLEESAKSLKDPMLSEASVARIAYECGFNSPSSFVRSFRKKYQMSPSEYRVNTQAASQA